MGFCNLPYFTEFLHLHKYAMRRLQNYAASELQEKHGQNITQAPVYRVDYAPGITLIIQEQPTHA